MLLSSSKKNIICEGQPHDKRQEGRKRRRRHHDDDDACGIGGFSRREQANNFLCTFIIEKIREEFSALHIMGSKILLQINL